MKKEGIQSRNRKLSVKSRRRRRARSASAGTSMAAAGVKYNCERLPLFSLPPAGASPLDTRTVTSYLGAEHLPCGLVGATGSGLSTEQRPYYQTTSRYAVGDDAGSVARYFTDPHTSIAAARYAAAASTSGCAAMMGGAGHVTPWGASSSPYHHLAAGPCASSPGIISAIV